MGVPPNRLEVLSEIAGIRFAECYPPPRSMEIDGIPVPVISLEDLRHGISSRPAAPRTRGTFTRRQASGRDASNARAP